MHNPFIRYVVVAVLSAVGGGAAMFRHALLFGEDPYLDGPRAFIIEFVGMWIAAAFLFLSFMEPGKSHQWIMRGLAILFGVAGIVLGSYFSEIAEWPDPSGTGNTSIKGENNSVHIE